MNRIVLALAAAVLGTGCIVTNSSPGDGGCGGSYLTVTWDFTDANGATARTCATASVSNVPVTGVDVLVDGNYVTQAPMACTYYGTSPIPVAAGVHDVMVEGLDANGYIVSRDRFNATVPSCGDLTAAAHPAEGYVNLNYTTPNGVAGDYLWFSVSDLSFSPKVPVAVVDGASSYAQQTTYAWPNDVVFPLPLGDYTLDWMQQVYIPNAQTAPAAVYQYCSPSTFHITAPGTTTVNVTLATASGTCY